jgi:chromosome partitioning protein
MPRTITVASQKGGVGKTTTAVNLAASLCMAGHQVLLLDLDPQANASSGVGFHPAASSSSKTPHSRLRYLSALLEGEPLDPFIQETRFANLAILPSSPEVTQLDVVQAVLDLPADQLRPQIRSSVQKYQFLLIDCPPSLGGLPALALNLCDSVIIPIQCEYYAMEGLSQILPLINKIQKTTNDELEIEGLLLTMFSPDLDLSNEVVDEISGYFKELTFRSIIPRDVTLAEAASHGRPAFQYAPSSRGAWGYIELAREVMGHGET